MGAFHSDPSIIFSGEMLVRLMQIMQIVRLAPSDLSLHCLPVSY